MKNSVNYLITSADRQYYQYLSESDLNGCVPLTNSRGILCERPNHWFMASREDCAWNLFNHLQSNKCTFDWSKQFAFWRELRTGHRLLFVTTEPMKITTICGDSVSHKTISGEGVLRLYGDCSIKTMHFIMEPRVVFSDELNEVAVFPNSSVVVLNMVNSTKLDLPELSFARSNQSMTQSMLDETKRNLRFREIGYHDVHHYGMIYLLVAIIIGAIIYVACKMSKMGRLGSIVHELRNGIAQPTPAPRQSNLLRPISMPQIP